MIHKEIIACADGGPTPPPHILDPETAYYVGIYDETGTILCEFFDNQLSAEAAFGSLPFTTE